MWQLLAAVVVFLPLILLVLVGAQVRDALRALALTAGTAPVTVSNHAEQIAQLESQLKALARDFNDLDERAEHRYRKITQRGRRAEQPAPDELIDPQQVFSLLPPQPPAEQPQAAAVNGRRMMRAPR